MSISTRNHLTILAPGLVLCVAAGAALISSASAAGSTIPSAATTVPPVSTEPAPVGSDPIVSAAPGDGSTVATTAASTGAEAVALSIDLVAEIPDRAIHAFYSDGTLLYGDTRNADFSQAFVAIDANGAIVNEAADPNTLFGSVVFEGSVFFFGANSDGCGIFPFDLTTLTVGTPLPTSNGPSCGGGITVEDAAPSVAWVPDRSSVSLVRVDLAAGSIDTYPLGTTVPPNYAIAYAEVLNGIAYISLYADFDPVTNESYTAPDGSELPSLLLRFDLSTGTGTTIEAERLTVADDELFVYTDEGQFLANPATLELTPSDSSAGGGSFFTEGVLGDGVVWFVYENETGIVASMRNPETMSELAQASVALPATAENRSVNLALFIVGGQPMVVAEIHSSAADGTLTRLTQIYRVSGA